MEKTDAITLVAPCGMDCEDCAAYKVKNDPSLRELLVKKLNWNGIPCPGCRPSKGNHQFVDGTCATYACINKRGHDFCFECSEFPCSKLNPASDKAGDLPHNIKLFAQCYIKQHGAAKWREKAAEVKQKYFRGKMVIGKGPQLD
jgi:hypothetical protein